MGNGSLLWWIVKISAALTLAVLWVLLVESPAIALPMHSLL